MSGSKGYVLDSSAVLALLQGEAGQEVVLRAIAGGETLICAANYSEVMGKLLFRSVPQKEAVAAFDALGLRVVPFDGPLALAAALLEAHTAKAGLSLGDRACLALSQQTGYPALTADKAWARLKFHPKVQVIR